MVGFMRSVSAVLLLLAIAAATHASALLLAGDWAWFLAVGDNSLMLTVAAALVVLSIASGVFAMSKVRRSVRRDAGVASSTL